MDLSIIKAEHSADPQKETGGAVLDFGEFKLVVARWGNANFSRVFREVIGRPELRRIRDRLTPEQDRQVVDEVIARTILVGWKDIEQDGVPLPYSKETALELLKADFLRERVIAFSRSEENYRLDDVQAGVDTLKKSSSSTSPTAPSA